MTRTGRIFSGTSVDSRRFGYVWEIYYNRRGNILRCWQFLFGGGTSSSVVRVRVVGHFRVNYEGGGVKSCRISKAYRG